ncbi:unnamed protein product [marine sediment metagenome]|uniref:Uncharacterized protein n=1 Tax=marine sediment metagenome TaxID=412755 RepID=X1DJ50_9ZZZZ
MVIFLGSSTVEHPAVNRRVVGSNPTRGAKTFSALWHFAEGLLYFFIEKEGFLEFIIVYNIKIQNKCTIN